MNLSIVIPNHNGKELLASCLNSIYAYPPSCDYEIIVVDDFSQDGSVEMIKKRFPPILVISNQENRGFSYTVNRGIEKSQGKYILLLNSDTLVLENSLNLIVEFMEQNPYVDICGCRLLSADGAVQRSNQTFPSLSREVFHANPIFKKIYKGENSFCHKMFLFFLKIFEIRWGSFMDYNKIAEVDVVSGAAFVIRREVVGKIGLLDESYFMYTEEVDYCYRLKRSGGRIYYYPNARIIHLLGQTTKQDFKKGDWVANSFLIERYKSTLLFFKKHYSKKKLLLLRLVILEGFLIRIGTNFVKWLFYVNKREQIRNTMKIYKTIIRLAIHL